MMPRYRSLLSTAGARLGFFRSRRALDVCREEVEAGTLQARLKAALTAVDRLTDQNRELQAKLEERVTRSELRQMVDAAFGNLESGIDERFETQARFVEALRTMVGHTDELLERVLEDLAPMMSEEGEAPMTAPWSVVAAKH